MTGEEQIKVGTRRKHGQLLCVSFKSTKLACPETEVLILREVQYLRRVQTTSALICCLASFRNYWRTPEHRQGRQHISHPCKRIVTTISSTITEKKMRKAELRLFFISYGQKKTRKVSKALRLQLPSASISSGETQLSFLV